MKVKGTALGRLLQSLEIYRQNFFSLTIAYFLLLGVFQYALGLYGFWLYSEFNLPSTFNKNFDRSIDIWTEVITSPQMMIGIVLIMIGFLAVSLLVIPIKAATIRGAQQAYLSKTVTAQENFMFGMRNIFGIFTTYYYIFLYVAAIPVAILFLGLIISLFGVYTGNNSLGFIGGGIVFISLLVLLVFSIYRGVKAKFAIYNAVSKSEFSSINFKESVELTAYQWWRIVGNMVLFTICFWVFTKIILLVASILGVQSGFQIGDILDNIIDTYMYNPRGGITPQLIMNAFEGVGKMTIGSYIYSFISSLLNVFGTVLGIIYFFLLFKILQIDNGEAELEIDNVSGRKMDDHNPQISKSERGMIEEL